MIRISRIALLRVSHISRKLIVRQSSNSPLLKYNINEELENLYNRHKDKIIHSSYIDSTKLKLGYRRNKILEDVISHRELKMREEYAKVQPFPVALSYLNEDKETITEIKDDYKFDPFKHQGDKKGKIFLDKFVQNELQVSKPNDTSWMKDYEFYDDNEEDEYSSKSVYGTEDPSIPVSKVPCHGCGALLQCASSGLPGYLPSELFKKRTKKELSTIVCQRCHFLKTYNTAINLTVTPEEYIKMISSIQDKYALAILMVDLLDFPCSIWPGIADILGDKRPIIVVGNKVDLLPKDCPGYLENVKKSLLSSLEKQGINQMNVKHVHLLSAQTGYGVEELITKLQNIWHYKGDVYVVGCTNVGKSTLFNALLRSDYCKVKAKSLVHKATASMWPGTTLQLLKFPIMRPSDSKIFMRTQRLIAERSLRQSETKQRLELANETGKAKHIKLIGHIGETFSEDQDEVTDPFSMGGGLPKILSLNENSDELRTSKWCYDTPGVMHPEQILSLLTTEELLKVIPSGIVRPRTYFMKPNTSLLLAGLGRLDFIDGSDCCRFIMFASNQLPVVVCNTSDADEIYSEFLGTELLAVPCGDEDRLKSWPRLKSSDELRLSYTNDHHTPCDVVLSSAGWVAPQFSSSCEILVRAWTPDARGIYIRSPSLIPFSINLRGKRIRGSVAYKIGNAFVRN